MDGWCCALHKTLESERRVFGESTSTVSLSIIDQSHWHESWKGSAGFSKMFSLYDFCTLYCPNKHMASVQTSHMLRSCLFCRGRVALWSGFCPKHVRPILRESSTQQFNMTWTVGLPEEVSVFFTWQYLRLKDWISSVEMWRLHCRRLN